MAKTRHAAAKITLACTECKECNYTDPLDLEKFCTIWTAEEPADLAHPGMAP